MPVSGKRKCIYKSLHEKCETLKDLEKGMGDKDVAAKEHFINLGQEQR